MSLRFSSSVSSNHVGAGKLVPRRMIVVSQKSKSNPSIRLLLLRSVPVTGEVPRWRIHEYSLWNANPARLVMNGL